MENKKLLTVAIPTYNRPHNLKKILKQLKDEPAELFEIIVTDDASPDAGATEKMAKKYTKALKNFFGH